jgi:CRISPR/Cas system CSM-associated protein Csm4 (group 5 of RAMP superfamily)
VNASMQAMKLKVIHYLKHKKLKEVTKHELLSENCCSNETIEQIQHNHLNQCLNWKYKM